MVRDASALLAVRILPKVQFWKEKKKKTKEKEKEKIRKVRIIHNVMRKGEEFVLL